VTPETVKDFALADVVMPMLGHDVKLPKNEQLVGIYNSILEADGLSMAHFHGQQSVEATSASGSYRKIIAKPEDVQFDIVEMQNENEDLLTANYLCEPDPTPQLIEPFEGSNLPKITKALRIRFNLKPSSYATMMLREVTRMSSAF
jgi:tRNA pseudouridine13 synthase